MKLFNSISKSIVICTLLVVVSAASQTSWKGTTSTSWTTSSNWTNGVPTSSVDAIIGDANFTGASQPTISSTSTCKSLTIGAGTKASTLTLTRSLTASGNITIGSNGTINQSGSFTLSLTGNWNKTGTYNATSNGSVVAFSGSAQTLTGATTFRRLTVNSGSTVTLFSAISVARPFTVNGTFDPGSFLVTMSNNFVVNAGGTIRVNTALYSGNYSKNPTTLSSSSTVDYASSTVNQTVSNTLTYGTLRISGGLTKSLAGNLPSLSSNSAAAGNVMVAGGTLDLSNFTANRGTTVAGGALSISNGATLKIGGTNTFPSNYASHALGATSTVEYSGTNQTVSFESYGSLTLSSSSGAVVKTMPGSVMTIATNLTSSVGSGTSVSFSAGNSITVGGDLTIGLSTTFTGGSFTHSLLGNWVNNGTYSGGTGKVTMSGTNMTITGTGIQGFNNLEISGSGISIPGTVSIPLTGNLSTIGAGTLTHASGGTITMSGAGKSTSGAGLFLANLTVTGSVTATSSLALNGNLSLSGTGTFTATAGTLTMSGSSKTITNTGSGAITLNQLNATGTISTAVGFSMNSNLQVNGSLTATGGTVTFIGTSDISGSANLFNVVVNGTRVQLGGNATLGIAGSLTLTAGILDVSSTIPNTVNYNGGGAQSVVATAYHNLTLAGSGTKSASAGLTLNGDIVINSGSTFAGGSFVHTLYGNWTNNGTFTPGTSTIQFAGNVDATLGGSSITTFTTATLDKQSSSNIIAVTNSVVVGTLNMTSGQIHIPDTSKSVTMTTTRTGPGSIIGKITRIHLFSNGIAYAFESPKNTVTFTGGGTNPGSITVKILLNGPSDFIPPGTTISRTFEMNQSGGSGYTSTVSFNYTSADLNGNDPVLLHTWRYVGGAWVDSGQTFNDDIGGKVVKSGITDIIGRWTLQSKISGTVDWLGTVSGEWENASNWSVVSGNPALPPDDSVFVRIGYAAMAHQPTVSSNVAIRSLTFGSAEAATLTLGTGSSFAIHGSSGNLLGNYTADVTHLIRVNDQSLTIGGNIALSDGTPNRRINLLLGNGIIMLDGRLDQAGNSDISVTGNGIFRIAGDWNRASTATFAPSSGTVVYDGPSDQIVAGGITYNHLDIRKASGTATLSSPITVTGDLTVDSTAGIFLSTATTISVAGNVSVASGTSFNATSTALSVGGNWSGGGTFIPGSGTVLFNGNGSQSVAAASFNNVVISKPSGSAALTGSVNINGDLSILSSSLDLSLFTANRTADGGIMTLGAGAVLRIGTGSILPDQFSLYAFDTTSVVEFYGTNPQTIPAISYGNLTLTNGGANAKSLAGSVTVAGDLTVNNGATLNSGAFPLALNGNWVQDGSFTPGTGTIILTGSTKSVTSTSNLDLNDFSVPGSYILSAPQLHPLGNFDVTGSLDVGTTTTILDGDLTNRGSLRSDGTTTFSGTRVQTLRLIGALLSASTGIVNFNGTVQPILNSTSPPTFVTLNINNTAGVAPSTGWTVFGPMTIAVGSSFIGGNLTHNFFGSVTNNGVMTSSGTLNFTPPGTRTILLNGIQFTSTGIVNFGGAGQLTISGSNPTFNAVTISNTNASGVAASSNWNIGSNFNVNAGSIFHLGSGQTMTIGGTFSNSGVFDGGTSTVIMNNPTTADITGSGSTVFNNLSIDGVITALSDLTLTGNFSDNGTFDGSNVDLFFTGNSSSTIGGSTSPISIGSIVNLKSTATTTLAADLIDVISILDSTGTLDLSTRSVTQDVGGGILGVRDGATLKIGGSGALPTFDVYNFSAASTVEYNGAASQSVNATPQYGNLTLSTGGTKTASGPLTIQGTLSILGAVFADGGNTATVNGNLFNNSTATGLGKILLAGGATNHEISGNGSFANLELNDILGASLSNNVTANGTLTLTSGVLMTGVNTISLSSSGNVARTTGYVFGNLQKYIPTGAPSRTFEIGDSNQYAPVIVAFTGATTAGNLMARTAAGDHPNIASSGINASKSVNRFWSLTNTGVVFSTYSATFNFVPSDIDAGAAPASFVVAKYNGSAWSPVALGTRTGTSTQITGVNSFSDFQVGEAANNPVPTITSLSPTNNTVGDTAFILTVNGTNYVATSVVRFNGSDRATTFGSSTLLTAVIPSTDLMAAGIDSVYVFNPSPGGGRSNANPFTVNKAATTTSLVSNLNPSSNGQSVTLTATVAPTTGSGVIPSGSVSLKDGLVNLGSGSLDGTGHAVFTTSSLLPGIHSLTVVYAGNGNFFGSTSSVLSQTVNPQITASAGSNGSISPSGTITVNYGTDQSYSTTPTTGYHVDSLIVDGANLGALTSYTFTGVSANHTIRAVFAIDIFTITATAGSGGSISPSGAVSVNYGSNQSFTVSPNTGYHIDSVIVDGTNQGQVGSYTFNNVTANHTIRTVYAIDQFIITSTAGTNGTISPLGATTVNYGSNQSFTVSASTGYHIDSVIVDGVDQGQVGSYTFNIVTTNHTIRTVYAIDQFTISATAGSNGSISPSGSVSVNYGSNQSFTVSASTGYHIDSVLVDGVDQGQVGSYTFNNVTANHTIRTVTAIDQFTITATAGSNGSISPSGSVSVNYGSDQSFTVTPNAGYHIDSVIVDGVDQGQVGSYTFNNVTANHTIRTVYAIDQFTIAATSGSNGSISPSGSVDVNYGSNQSFTVSANTGYHIDSVLVDGVDQGQVGSYTFNNVTANHSIRTVYAIDQFTLTATAGSNGSISPSGSVSVNYGSNQSFTVSASTGYHIDSVIVDGVDQGQVGSYTFNNVTANHTIRTVYAIDQFTISATAGSNGSISPSGAISVNYGANQSFTVTANTGYHIDSVIVDGVDQGQVGSYTFNNVTANHSIRTVYAIDQFTISATAGSNGSISPSGSVSVNYGSNQSFTVSASTGYHIDTVIVDGVDQGQVGSYTFNNVTANHTIRTVYAIDQFTISATAGSNGSISPSGAISVNYGSNQSFTVTANTGYHIDSVLVDGVDQGQVGSYTFNNVTANHSIRTVYAIDQFIITSTAGTNGTISPLGATTVNYGLNQSFTVSASTGYHIDSVLVDGVDQGQVGSYTFNNVTANHTIRTVYAIDQFTITATAGSNGSISPSGAISVNYGSNQSFAVTANTGYHIDSVLVDGVDQGQIGSYTFNNVTANHTIRTVYAIDQFTISATAGSNGSISPSGSVSVNYGSNQSFTVTANTGYHIDSVIVDGVDQGQVGSYTFNNVTGNHTIRTVYAIDQFTISATAGSNGSISPSGSVAVNYGSNPLFTITPNVGHHIDSVFVDGADQGPVASFTFSNVDSNHSIRAVFAINLYSLHATAGINGTISPAGLVTATYGSSHLFTIAPSTGYHIDSVIVDGADQGPIASYTFTSVTANHTIRTVYTINQYVLNATAGANGSISPSGPSTVTYGSSQSFTINANTGYHVDSVLVDGVDQGQVGSYTFTNVTANHAIRTVYAIDQFIIASMPGTNGSISPSGPVSVNYGANQSFTVTANTGYHIDSVIVDGVDQGQVGSYTFNNVTANHTIRTAYAIDQFTIAATAGSNGSISPSGSVSVNYGSNQSFTVTSNTGYHIDSVIVDGVDQGQVGSYTFNNVTANHAIRTVYAIDQFIITSTSGTNGTISPLGATTVNYGSNQSFSVSANTGYHIDSVIVDGANQGQVGSYTFNNVTANHTIRSVYAIDRFTILSTSGSNGSITPNGSVNVNYGSNQSFTITANPGYHIDSVLVDGANQGQVSSYSFGNVTANHTIRTVYAINQFTITASAGSNGTISPSGGVIVNYGSNAGFSATPNPGYRVDSVIVDGVYQGPLTSYIFTNVTANHTIRAVFAITTHAIISTSGAHGSVTPLGTTLVNNGANQVFTITPNTGYHVDSVIVDGTNAGPLSAYTFTSVTAPHTIRAVFSINMYSIMASTGFHGTISPLGTSMIPYGGSQAYTMAPDPGYHVSSVLVDGVSVGSPVSYSFTSVSGNHTIAVLFVHNDATITASAGPNGAISPNGSVTVPYGSDQTFTMTPNSLYMVDSVFVDGGYVGSGSTYTFTNVSSDHTILAIFNPVGVKYRTFVYDSLHIKKGVKKKATTTYWEFRIVNTRSTAIGEVNVQFKNDVKQIVSSSGLVPTGLRKNWVFAGSIAPNDTVIIKGRSLKPVSQTISKLWLGPITGTPIVNKFPSLMTYELPMPNIANVRDEAFARGAFVPTNGLIVGVPRPDSAKKYGWVRIMKSSDMFQSVQDRAGYHNGVSRGFDKFSPSNKPFIKEQKRLGPSKYNNKYFADVMTLKFNIAISALRITPLGLGELRYREHAHPFDSLLVREIAQRADSSLTFFKNDNSYYARLDSAIMKINLAFSGNFDTTSWSDTLKIKGTRDVSTISYLSKTSIPPAIIAPLELEIAQNVPEAFELYQNYPNPFNPTTTIEFELNEPSIVTLKVYNVVGQEVAVLFENEPLDDGHQQIDFNANGLASGVYFYRLMTKGISDDDAGSAASGQLNVAIKKMLLVK